MRRLCFSHPLVRAGFCLLLLALPLASAWNLAVAPSHPALSIKIGPKLGGVTYDVPVILSWSALRDGSLRKAIANHVRDIRPSLSIVPSAFRNSTLSVESMTFSTPPRE